ncbi:MAG: phasin family protein [Gemmatimonadota bacterium]|nr:phasin family protein [Gemmatimonadota bacterium]MDE3171931.1 phasin family protein [Gemmatimonadota bacterium]MDE3215807.1 phasin family protein [Gemmatimonadota bacterium]
MPKSLAKQAQLPMLRDSAYQIWLAGLGALSIAEDESGRIFKTLVNRGRAFEASTRDRLIEVKDRLDVRKAAAGTVDMIAENLDEGMSGVLGRLGVPTKREIDGLSKRVERLTKTLEERPAARRPRKVATRRRAKVTA